MLTVRLIVLCCVARRIVRRIVSCRTSHLKQQQTPFHYEYDDRLALIALHTSGFPLPPHLNDTQTHVDRL